MIAACARERGFCVTTTDKEIIQLGAKKWLRFLVQTNFNIGYLGTKKVYKYLLSRRINFSSLLSGCTCWFRVYAKPVLSYT